MAATCVQNINHPKYWRYVVVFAVFLCLFLTVGVIRSSAMFYGEWMEYFEAGSSITTALGVASAAVFNFCAPIGSSLSVRFGTRPVVMSGGVLVTIGLFASAFAPNVYVLFGTYGVTVGLGYALSTIPMLTILVHYFPKNPGLALGLATVGLGVGGVVLPVLIEFLVDVYTWRGMLIVLSAVSFNICITGLLARPVGTADDTAGEIDIGLKKSLKVLFSNVSFVLLALQSIFYSISLHVVVAHLKSAIVELAGTSDTIATYGISVLNGANGVAFILFGLLLNRYPNTNGFVLLIVVYVIFGISLFVFPEFKLFEVMYAHCAIIGVCFAPNFSCLQIVLTQVLGLQFVDLSFGVLYGFIGIGAIAGSLMAGFAYDVTTDYGVSFYIAGASIMIGNLLLLMPCIHDLRTQSTSYAISETPDVKRMSEPVSTTDTNDAVGLNELNMPTTNGSVAESCHQNPAFEMQPETLS